MKKTLMSAAVLLAMQPFAALALPIVYTYTGIGSGTLGGSAFSGAAFTITANADTANVTAWSAAGGGPQNTHLSTVINVSGLGSFSITTPSHTWLAQNCCGGIGANLSSNWISMNEPGFVGVGYGLTTSLGPVTEGEPFNAEQFFGVATSGGTLSMQAVSTVTFQAFASPVPEPATLLLWASGVAGLAGAVCRRAGKAS